MIRRLWKSAVRRWLREAKRLELLRFRQRWAAKFDEYECLGGPDDGKTRVCHEYARVYVNGGHYAIDQSDWRLHFKMRSRVEA